MNKEPKVADQPGANAHNPIIRYGIRVTGTVQGVGFRPFVYRLALLLGLRGWVNNDPNGVTIDVEGEADKLEDLLRRLTSEAPPLAHIETCRVRQEQPYGYGDFTIWESRGSQSLHDGGSPGHSVLLSTDIAMCGDCREELLDPQNRRYRYPFISCTNCGPRFTIITAVPYDRPHTTMSRFGMCEDCSREYHNPMDRRFHAQPIACPACGPSVALYDRNGNRLGHGTELEAAARLLTEGHILAVKGLGGYHLVCDAAREESVLELRRRKHRDSKPFALMAKDLDTVRGYCEVSAKEEELLSSPGSPIVLLNYKSGGPKLSTGAIAPDNKRLGIMLPYTPLHQLLFGDELELLVMTSGNRSGEPVCYTDEAALDQLSGIADYFLVHNREIHTRTDDSLTSEFRGVEAIIRRSRGYVPEPIDISCVMSEPEWERWNGMLGPDGPGILACGAELKNTFCLVKGRKAFLSHHIGDLENLETMGSYEEGIRHFTRIFAMEPSIIACDKHPDYSSTRYAEGQLPSPPARIQHHHAHIAACMAENGLNRNIIGIAYDGTGYGEDGRIWGGEFFTGGYSGFHREACLEYVPMPGGDASIKEPWRMALSYMALAYGGMEGIPAAVLGLIVVEPERVEWGLRSIERGLNAPFTSSMGRLFDGVAALLGLCSRVGYEGQAAIRLEAKASETTVGYSEERWTYPYELTEQGGLTAIRLGDLIRSIVDDRLDGIDLARIAAAFHRTVAVFTTEMCIRIRERSGIQEVALSGGVFQNRLLMGILTDNLEAEGFRVYTHRRIPVNDGGISLGQAVMAMHRYLKNIGEEGGEADVLGHTR